MNKPAKLIPLGTRILHWNGCGHGFGTIIAYNGIPENSYLRQNFGEAVNLVAKAGIDLMGALVNSMYDGGRYPYVVHFDPRTEKDDETEHCASIRTKYPRGYCDTYTGGDDSTELTLTDQPNVFPNDTVLFVCRQWLTETNEWTAWVAVNEMEYNAYKNHPDYQCIARG